MAIPVNNEVIGVDLSSREQFWRYEHPQRHFPFYSSALSVDGTIVIGGRDRMVHAIDQASGEGRWTFRMRARIDSSPVAARRRLVIGSGDGHLYMLDLESGENLWEFDIGAPLSAFPRHCRRQSCDRLRGRHPLLLRVSIPRPR